MKQANKINKAQAFKTTKNKPIKNHYRNKKKQHKTINFLTTNYRNKQKKQPLKNHKRNKI